MRTMPKNKLINLLPQEEFDASILGRTLRWAMGTFRIIVIVTEMVVMGAFLSRFWLDAQNSDLSDSLKTKTAQIQAQGDFEKEFREIQKKLSIYKTLSQEIKQSDLVDKAVSGIPVDVVLSSVTIQDGSMVIKGKSGSELSVAQLVSNLKSDKSFKKVALGSVNSSNDDSSLIFTVNVSY